MKMRTPLVLILAMIAQVGGNILLSKGMKQTLAGHASETSYLIVIAYRVLESPQVWAGVLLLIIFFGLFTALLSWADLSFVLPASSFGYVLNVTLAHYFLLEPVSVSRWCGTALISVGVVLVSITGSRSGGGWKEFEGSIEESAQ